MKSFINSFVPAAIILLFSYAAVSKLTDVTLFRSQMYLQPFSHTFANLLVYAVPGSEIIAIALLCTDRFRFTGLIFSVGLLSAFTGYIAFLLIFRQGQLPCSCGGILNHLSWKAHIVFNCFFIAAGLIAVGNYPHSYRPKSIVNGAKS